MMASIRKGNVRRRRAFWRARGHQHIKFNRGVWRYLPEDLVAMGIQLTADGHEQPRAYRYYPQGS